MPQPKQAISWPLVFEHLSHLAEKAKNLYSRADRTSGLLKFNSRWSYPPLLREELSSRLESILDAASSSIEFCNAHVKILSASELCSPAKLKLINQQVARLKNAEDQYALVSEITHQRTGTHSHLEYLAPDSDSEEFCNLQILYRAADALAYSLSLKIYGRGGLEQKEDEGAESRVPLALFSRSRGYGYSQKWSIAVIPESDLLHPRLWAALAHEISHGRINELLPVLDKENVHLPAPSGMSENDVAVAGEAYRAALGLVRGVHERILGNPPLAHRAQVVELLADAVGAHLAGPATLLTLLAVGFIDNYSPLIGESRLSVKEQAIKAMILGWACQGYHPPMHVRVWVILEVLRRNGLDKKSLIYSIAENYENLDALHPYQRKALGEWRAIIPKIVEAGVEFADAVTSCSPYGKSEMSAAQRFSLSPNGSVPPSQLDASVILNAGWNARLRRVEEVIKEDLAPSSLGIPLPSSATYLAQQLLASLPEGK